MSQQICDLQDLLSVSVHVPSHVAKRMSSRTPQPSNTRSPPVCAYTCMTTKLVHL